MNEQTSVKDRLAKLDNEQPSGSDASVEDIWVGGLATLEGYPMGPETLTHEAGFNSGKRLTRLTAQQAQKVRETLEALVPDEAFCHGRQACLQSIQLPYKTPPKSTEPHSSQWTTTSNWCKPLRYGTSDPCWTALGALSIYLTRMTGQSKLQLGVRLKKYEITQRLHRS